MLLLSLLGAVSLLLLLNAVLMPNSGVATSTKTTNRKSLSTFGFIYGSRHLRSAAIVIEVTSRHTECTHFNLDFSRMSVIALQW